MKEIVLGKDCKNRRVLNKENNLKFYERYKVWESKL